MYAILRPSRILSTNSSTIVVSRAKVGVQGLYCVWISCLQGRYGQDTKLAVTRSFQSQGPFPGALSILSLEMRSV